MTSHMQRSRGSSGESCRRRKDRHSDNEDSQELDRGGSALLFLIGKGWNLGGSVNENYPYYHAA